jgi:hypothetical protein
MACMWLVWRMWGSVIIATLVTLPMCAIAARYLAIRRKRAGQPHPARTALLDVAMVAGTLPWIWMILTPSNGTNAINLIPFRDLAAVLTSPPSTVIVQVGGNLLVFAALGALPPMRFPRMAGLAPVAAVAAAGSITVEALQHLLHLGRVSSVDDVVLNVAGAALAALVTRRRWADRIPARVV